MTEINSAKATAGFLGFLQQLATGKQAEKLGRYEDGILIVDTCIAGDTGKPETGILHPDYHDHFIIVEDYSCVADALAGHEKWVKLMLDPPDELVDIDTWGLGLEPYRRKAGDAEKEAP